MPHTRRRSRLEEDLVWIAWYAIYPWSPIKRTVFRYFYLHLDILCGKNILQIVLFFDDHLECFPLTKQRSIWKLRFLYNYLPAFPMSIAVSHGKTGLYQGLIDAERSGNWSRFINHSAEICAYLGTCSGRPRAWGELETRNIRSRVYFYASTWAWMYTFATLWIGAFLILPDFTCSYMFTWPLCVVVRWTACPCVCQPSKVNSPHMFTSLEAFQLENMHRITNPCLCSGYALKKFGSSLFPFW